MIEKLLIAAASSLVSGGIALGMAKAKIDQLRRDVNNLGSLRRKDVDGVGRKLNRLELVLLGYCKEDQRRELVKLFLDSNE